jgi:hypothetical protein
VLPPSDVRGRLAHSQLAATPDLATLAPLQHVPVDAVGRCHVLVSDLVGKMTCASIDPGLVIACGRRLNTDPVAPVEK